MLTAARLGPGRYCSRFRICAALVELYCPDSHQTEPVSGEEGRDWRLSRNNQKGAKKMGGLGATLRFAAAPNRPFFQDNLLNNQSSEFSRKFFH
jgi:hypothetical protein